MCFSSDVVLIEIQRPEYIQFALKCDDCKFEFVNNYTGAMSGESRKIGLKENYNMKRTNPVRIAREKLYRALNPSNYIYLTTEASKINQIHDIIEANNELVSNFGNRVITVLVDISDRKSIIDYVKSNLDFSKLSKGQFMYKMNLKCAN